MRILLLGANGQVGRALQAAAPRLGELICATRDGKLPSGAQCLVADFTRPESLSALIRRVAPDIVVNAAAYTAVDRAESEPELAWQVNAEAPRVLAQACAEQGALLVHYSTDYVFDGSARRPYREDDPTSPLGVYGASKLAGEQNVRDATAHHLILRVAWVYSAHGANFLLTMLRLGKERGEVRVVADQVGTPTSAPLIADVTCRLLGSARRPQGTLHLTAAGSTSWHGFAQGIFEGATANGLLGHAVHVVPIGTADYPTPARRPAYSCLETALLRSDFGIQLPDWRAELEQVLGTMKGLG